MAFWQSIAGGVKALFRSDAKNREIEEELKGFLEASAEEKMRRGMTPEQAQRAARAEMGSAEMVRHKVRSSGWESTVEAIWQDVRYGVRMLKKSPGFALVAILSLALGIGGNTAIFTLVNNLMLQSLPVRNPQQLVAFGKEFGACQCDGIGPGPLDIFTYDFYQRIQKQNFFQGITAFSSFSVPVSVRTNPSGSGQADRATSYLVAGNFFSVLGAEPMLGRAIAPSDADAAGRSPVAVISYRYWQQVLAADSAVIGRQIAINGTLFTVIGVMPPKFYGVALSTSTTDMWLPLTMQPQVMMQPSLLDPHGLFWLHMMARRNPGVSIAQAQAWVTSQLQQFMVDREGTKISADRRADIRKIYVELLSGGSGISDLRDIYGQPLAVLAAVVGLVLLIACANLANFLLAKAAARERELSTRLALGSSRGRIVRQILTEALLLSLTGGALGLLLAFLGTQALIHFLTAGAARTSLSALPDLHVLAFTLGVSMLTAVLFGLAPAVRVSRISVTPILKANARSAADSGGRASQIFPKALVVLQVTLSLILLAGAAMFVRTLRNLENTTFGFERRNVLLMQFNPKFAGYQPEQLNALYDRMLDRLNALPGVRSATISGAPPISGGSWNSPIYFDGYTPAPRENISTLLNRVAPKYFETLGIPLLQGRPIGAGDTATSLKVAVVNQATADHFYPHGDAIGHRFTVADPATKGATFEIVGVVKGSKYNSPREDPQRMIYLPVEQLTGDDAYAYCLQLLTVGDPDKIAGAVRAALAGIDPSLPIIDVKTISEVVDQRMGNERLISQLAGFFSLLALLLACIGLYGVMSYSVVRRTNEIGIRLALGAQTTRVLWMILRESLLMLAIGLAVGLPATIAAMHLVQSSLYGLRASDPLTLAEAGVAIVFVTMIASYFPARRAMKVDPMVALRYE
jgi:predicted permease